MVDDTIEQVEMHKSQRVRATEWGYVYGGLSGGGITLLFNAQFFDYLLGAFIGACIFGALKMLIDYAKS